MSGSLAVLVVLLIVGSAEADSQSYGHFTVASGGNRSATLSRLLDSTLGQPVVGTLTGTNERLCIGFWCDPCPQAPALDDDCDRVYTVAEPPCDSDPLNRALRPERIDGIFFGVSDDGDTQIDEALPPGAEAYDCDGDGYNGKPESGTPLCDGSNNDDKVYPVYPGSQVADDGVVDDGCAGGPAQVGAYSEAQFNIGLTDQDPCGTNGWPSDFASGGMPDSTNRVNILDLTSFLAPARRLDSSPGHPNFDDRWDLAPGHGFFNDWIAINDLTALLAGPSGYPPMLGGLRAFNAPVCPWPG